MAEPKTRPTEESVSAFIDKISDPTRKEDCRTVVEIMKDVTKEEPVMWGASIVGFGRYRQEYASGREAEWPLTGFSPRKGDLTIYLMPGFGSSADLMERLGKHKTGKSCLYIKKLADVDLKVLKEVVKTSVKRMAARRVK